MILAVESGDGRLGFGLGTHLHKPETLGAAGIAVGDNLGAGDGSVRRKLRLEIGAGHVIAQISDIQLTAHKNSPLTKIGRLTCRFTFLVSAEKRPKSGPGR